MRILHIISSGGLYGAETVILNLSRALNESGNHAILGVFSNSSNLNLQLHEAANDMGIESHLIPCAGQVDRQVTRTIRDLVQRTQADVVHAHGYKADVYVYFALRNSTVPFVSTCHNWLEQNPLVSFYGMVDRFVLRSFAGVVAVSEEVRQTLQKAGVKNAKVHLIRNGIDLRMYSNAHPSLERESSDELLIGWIGRLSYEKGADIFLRATTVVSAALPQARFVIVGDGPDREALESLIKDLNLEDKTRLLGRRKDIPAICASLDLLVSSSRQEGLPMAILEGMASGLPVVATSVGDVPTVVLDGKTGLLVASEDITALGEQIITLLQDKSRRRLYGDAAMALVAKEFSSDRMSADYLRLYQEAVKR